MGWDLTATQYVGPSACHIRPEKYYEYTVEDYTNDVVSPMEKASPIFYCLCFISRGFLCSKPKDMLVFIGMNETKDEQ